MGPHRVVLTKLNGKRQGEGGTLAVIVVNNTLMGNGCQVEILIVLLEEIAGMP